MSSSNSDVKKAIAIALTIILLFSGGYVFGMLSNTHLIGTGGEPQTVEPSVVSVAGTPAAAPAAAPAATPAASEPAQETPAADTKTDDKSGKTDKTDKTDKSGKEDKSSGAPSSKAEIVELFKTSANKIKTEATVVTRNYEDLQHNEEKLEVPAALKSIGSSLISTFLKKDETPVNYNGTQAIIADYPVKGQSYVTTVTEADVTEATCTDDGKYYNITLKFIEGTDPTTNGVATSFNIIKAEEVYAAASVVKSFSSTYYDAKIECKIDKATGHMVQATYTLPIVMKVTANLAITSLDAQVGMTFIDDYSITY